MNATQCVFITTFFEDTEVAFYNLHSDASAKFHGVILELSINTIRNYFLEKKYVFSAKKEVTI